MNFLKDILRLILGFLARKVGAALPKEIAADIREGIDTTIPPKLTPGEQGVADSAKLKERLENARSRHP